MPSLKHWYTLGVVGGAILLLLLILFALSWPSVPLVSSDGKAGSTSGANGLAGDSADAGSSGNDASAGQVDDVLLSQTTQKSSSDESKSSGVTVDPDHRSNNLDSVASESPEPVEGSAPSPLNIDVAQQPAGNQFFTMGGPRIPPKVAEGVQSDLSTVSDAFTGRTGKAKGDLLQASGGSATTEAAVKLGLEWLSRNQLKNGLWSLAGPYKDSSSFENSAAATAMALLAFQGAGHTHRGDHSEPFTKVVANGSSALLDHVFDANNVDGGNGRDSGYAQAMCTIALCELYGMTNDRKLRAPSLKAIEYCVAAQSPEGGWRYVPRQDSDTSVTGWFVMGLQSARMAKLRVPRQSFDGASQYLDAAANAYGSRYSYQPGLPPTSSMTAEALLCRQYLGWQRDDPRLQDGVQHLLSNLPEWRSQDVYYWYYATQVCHHMGGEPWKQWNSVMSDLLPAKQIKDGPERGSWDPKGDSHGSAGGRLYVTCMSLYILEVYYRYLPLYQDTATSGR